MPAIQAAVRQQLVRTAFRLLIWHHEVALCAICCHSGESGLQGQGQATLYSHSTNQQVYY